MVSQIAGHLINVMMISSIYLLAALGFALVFGVMRIMNFAHGAIYMVSGYVCYYFWVILGLNPWVALPLTMVAMAIIGLFLEKFCFRPFRGDFEKATVMAIILVIVLKTGADLTVGPFTKRLPSIVEGVITIGDINVNTDRLVILIICAILLTALSLFIQKSRTGLSMLAIAEDREAAALQGININRISALAFVMGCSLVGLAGGVMGSVSVLHVGVADIILIRIIAVVILSGIGTIGGIWAGGLVMGALDALCPYFLPAVYSDLTGFGLIILILVIRPQGFFGHEV
ncbi:MAG: branched-chain amino acid ABC transporter permease [Deltaproteobacteria bacterium]|nr:branched-chain amino acid ABC transporter permease [Deltaproteobacteria bacterium]